MKSKDNKRGKFIPKDNAALPPELEWDKMQDGILRKMEEVKAAEAAGTGRSKKGKLRTWGLAILLILLPVFCARFVVSPLQQRAEEINKQEGTGNSKGIDNGPEAITVAPQSPLTDKSSAAEGEQFSMIPGTKESTPDIQAVNINEKKTTHSAYEEDSREAVSGANQSSSPAAIIDTPEPALLTSPLEVLPEVRTGIANQKAAAPEKQLIQPVEAFLPTRAINKLEPASSLHALPLAALTTIETGILSNDQSQRPVDQIMVVAGISSWSEAYGETTPERAAYEQAIPSYHIQFNYLRTSNKGFLLMGGVQYQQLESRFDRVFELDEHSITLQDTITHILTNVLTGQQSIVRGDADINVTAERRIRHYNKIQLYQIPLAIGKSWSHKKWQAYALLGGSLNVFTMNTGRTAYEGNVLDYEGTSTSFLMNQWNFNAQLTGRLSYRVADHLSVVGGVQYQKSLSNWSTEQNVQMRPSVINVELGLSYAIGK